MNQNRLKSLLDYDPKTGIFTWKVKKSPQVNVGDIAGHLGDSGYLRIRIDGKIYKAHRLAWLYMYGSFPEKYLDHINNVRHDNRIENLREATWNQNQHNRKINDKNVAGMKGITWHKRDKRWQAQITVNGEAIHIGYFKDLNAAKLLMKQAREKHHGNFANHGVCI